MVILRIITHLLYLLNREIEKYSFYKFYTVYNFITQKISTLKDKIYFTDIYIIRSQLNLNLDNFFFFINCTNSE